MRAPLFLTLAACAHSVPSRPAPPVARTVDVVEERFGHKVADPYRWMETSPEEVSAWLGQQGAFTDAWLARLPGRAALAARVAALDEASVALTGATAAGGRLFYFQTPAGAPIPRLMVRGPDGADRVLVDPARAGSHASISSFAPSHDGKLVGYLLTSAGREVSALHVLEVDSGRERPDRIERIWGEFEPEWLPDGSGFFYTVMAPPAPGVDPMLGMSVRLHRLGEPSERDVLMLDRATGGALGLAPEDFPVIATQAGSRWVFAYGSGAHPGLKLAVARLDELDESGAGRTPWRKVADLSAGVEAFAEHEERLFLVVSAGSPGRRVVSVPAAAPDLAAARVELAEDPAAPIEGIGVAADALYVRRMASDAAQVVRRPWNGAPAQLALPFAGSIEGLATDPRRPGVTFRLEGWTRPASFLASEGGPPRPIGLEQTSPADFSAIIVEELEARSSDGTMVPLTVLRRRDLALDGSHPTILYGYGGYAISIPPSFRPTRLAWLERGGIVAIAHVRGGGEKGEAWHQAGSGERKMNGIRDFIACGEALVARRYTTAARLVAEGGSMGGVLVGRALTERPDLFAGAVISVGMVNPLRLDQAENGANQMVELASPATERGYAALLEMDPYQHVEQGVAYPAVLFTIGLNDRRVAPWMTAKMAARLQAATKSGKPVSVRVEHEAGHGIGSTREQRNADRVDSFAFELAAAGDPDFQPH